MTYRLSLLFASTALTAVLGLPVVAAMQTKDSAEGPCSGICAAVLDTNDQTMHLVRVSGEDDDDDHGGWVRRGHHDDDDEECDDDDDGGCTGARGNPAPAGTIAPPANGLFGNGAPPVAVTN